VGELDDSNPEIAFRKAADLGAFTAAFNVSGQPALSIPAGFAPDGRAFGAMLAGRRGDDLTVLRVGRQLEEVLRWRRLAEHDA
ncbi:MAG: amidase, partial [Deltaproteobacteria bacterium]|nr:amidase [Deltaproteobacteria bacterium]